MFACAGVDVSSRRRRAEFRNGPAAGRDLEPGTPLWSHVPMTPHGSSTNSTDHIPLTPNPYEELAAPGPGPGPNPYEALGRPDAAGYDGLLGGSLRPDDMEPECPAHGGSMPYLRAVRRRRRSRLRIMTKLAVALFVLLAFLAVGDRWAVLYAEGKAAEQVKRAAKLHARPEVHIEGFPFLTQLAAERLDEVAVTVPDMPAGRVSVAQVSGTVRDLRIVGDGPTAVKGAVLGRMESDVLLDYDDLNRELGTSQVRFTPGAGNTVYAAGELPVAGTVVQVQARAHLRCTSDHGVGTTVDKMRLDVPKLFSYTPGKDGGVRLARPLAERVRQDAAKAKALFRVGAVAERFGLSPERAERVRNSEAELARVTGAPTFLDRLMRVNMVDVLRENPWLLKKIGIDPSVLNGLKNLEEPELADKLSLNVNLPEMPGDVRLRAVTVDKEGIRAELTGKGIPLGDAVR